ncbi:MAG: sulfate ABC transporter substrate-binding protein [Planctomycetaceae bacterium]|nr:sulfate ABC transporter substrate-binding protein [Planctomycetaceae bacterium]
MRKKYLFNAAAGFFAAAVLLIALSGCRNNTAQSDTASAKGNELLNVSYDPTRELYEQYNEAFIKYWKEKTGETVIIKQSHGGSSKQALKVIEGLGADILTLGVSADIDAIAEKGKLLPMDWQKRFPNDSTPYTSTVVFLVRKGNPKNIKTWEDLVQPGMSIIAANPKTSAVARLSYLAGWGAILKRELGDLNKLKEPEKYAAEIAKAQEAAQAYTKEIYRHVKVLDSGARGASQTFIQRKQGDVLLNWENESYKALADSTDKSFEIVVPPISILADPSVAVVDKNVDKRGTRIIAEEYIRYLYSDAGQELAAKNSYRPHNKDILAKYKDNFAEVELFTVGDVFGGWAEAQKTHFCDGGVFDTIYAR